MPIINRYIYDLFVTIWSNLPLWSINLKLCFQLFNTYPWFHDMIWFHMIYIHYSYWIIRKLWFQLKFLLIKLFKQRTFPFIWKKLQLFLLLNEFDIIFDWKWIEKQFSIFRILGEWSFLEMPCWSVMISLEMLDKRFFRRIIKQSHM